jgi:hypothetical protein
VIEAQDCHSGTIEIGSDIRLKKIGEGDEGEAISSRRRVATLIQVWSMRSSLDTEIKRKREGRGRRESPTRAPWTTFKVGPARRQGSELETCLAWVRRGAESSGKDRQIRRPFHLDVQILRTNRASTFKVGSKKL